MAIASGGTGSGYSYHWNQGLSNSGSHLVAPINNTTYTVFATDSNNCSSDTLSILITVNPLPTVSASGLNVAYCSNDNSPVALTGIPVGGSFSGAGVSGSNFIAANSSVGNVNVIYSFTNTQGCTGKDTISTSVYAAPTIQFSGIASAYCINSANIPLSALPSGGSFTVNNNPVTVFSPSSLGVGNHKIKYFVTNVAGCSSVDSMNSFVNPVTAASFSGLNATYCDNDIASTLVGAPAGGSFLTDNGLSGNSFSPAVAGSGNHTLSYVFTNIYGCIDTATNFTVVYPKPLVNITLTNNYFCTSSSSVILTATPSGGVFSGTGVTGNSFSPANAGVGNHNIFYSYISPQSCTNSDTFVIQVANTITIDFSSVPSSFCLNNTQNSLPVNPTGGIWSGDGIIGDKFVGSSAGLGIHWLQYSYNMGNGCAAVDSLQVTVFPIPSAAISGNAMSYCLNSLPDTFVGIPAGGQFFGSGMSGNTFYPSIAGDGAKLIQYIYTDSNNCAATAVVSVMVNSLPVANAGIDILVPCSSSGLQIGANSQSGFSYFWSPSTGLSNAAIANPIAKPYGTTQYILTINNITTNCKNTDTVIVNVPAGPQISVSEDTSICLNDSVILSASGAPQFSWSNGTTNSFIQVSPAVSTQYFVVGTDALGCTSVDTVSVKVLPLPNPEFVWGSTVNMIGMDSLILYPGSFDSYLWSTGDTTPELIVFPSGAFNLYTVFVIDSNGCKQKDSIYVEIEGINDLFPGINAKLYPNPVDEFINIEFSQFVDLEYWVLLDINGKLIDNQIINSNIQYLRIDLVDLITGTYFLTLKSNEKTVTIKVIKK